ncbi:hypothetical protein CBM2629_B140052 [Cupriavidus taiwanensis]|nr:hypothetical protein CBM2629_B140052 [Cupriavidus taiwanensis]
MTAERVKSATADISSEVSVLVQQSSLCITLALHGLAER